MNNGNSKRALVLATDAFGGRGGIALYVRNLLNALCRFPQMERVVALPRKIYYGLETMPGNLVFRTEAARGKPRFLLSCFRLLFSEPRFNIIICTHLHLLPVGWLLSLFYRCPLIPVVYGIEAWTPTRHALVNLLCGTLKSFISIRRMTARRLIEWAHIPEAGYYYLPNCIDRTKYGTAGRIDQLLDRYGLRDKTVVMTAGRLDGGKDLNKGFDEMIEVLPKLRERIPDVVYLVVGDGDDKARLEEKARSLGVADITVFTGYVPEEAKADHYRLADVFAMPGSNPHFDTYPYRFVFLEALACGVPVVGSRLQDPEEIGDPDAQLIIQVDPNSREDIIEGILKAISSRTGAVHPGLEKFYYESFEAAFHGIINDIFSKAKPGSR